MKISFAFFLLLVFAGLTYLSENDKPLSSANYHPGNDKFHQDGILKSEVSRMKETSNYIINAELLPEKKKLIAREELIWINKTNFPAKEILIHLYPNAYKNSKTLFAKGRGITIDEKTKSEIKLSEVTVDGKPVQVGYVHPEVLNLNDSTVGRIPFDTDVNPGDSVSIKFKFEVPVPINRKRFGYAAGRNFFFISQWFPKAGVYENGKWISSQYHPFTNYFADFGKYEVQITVPLDYHIAATGVKTKEERFSAKKKLTFNQSGVHDFAWMASDEILYEQSYYERKDDSKIIINAFIQPENDKYKERFITAIKNSLKFFEEYIAVYPYKTITLVDAPKTSAAGGMEYPSLITVEADLFSPEETLEPEEVTVHEFVHQYFYGILANNEVYEGWLDEGLTSYITTKIMSKYYGEKSVHFKLAGYYPIFGLNFLSYNEIPLIYSLGKFRLPEGAEALMRYYNSPTYGALTDTSYKLPDGQSYGVITYAKPELVLLSFEKLIGRRKMMKIFKQYYSEYKFSHPTGEDFINVIKKNSKEDLNWFFDSYFYNPFSIDYKIRDIKQGVNPNEYEIFVEKVGAGVFKQEILLYTDKDTLKQIWDGKGFWTKLTFKTNNEVLGAELDPHRKNLLDRNFANNSYLVDSRIGGALSLSFRWFFWIQNLLLIIGSIA